MRDDRADGVVEDAPGDDEDDAGVQPLPRRRSRAGRGRSPGRRSRGRGRGRSASPAAARRPRGRRRGARWPAAPGRHASSRRAHSSSQRRYRSSTAGARPSRPTGQVRPDLAGVAVGDDAGVEGDEVAGLHDAVAAGGRRRREVMRTTSWVAGVVTPLRRHRVHEHAGQLALAHARAAARPPPRPAPPRRRRWRRGWRRPPRSSWCGGPPAAPGRRRRSRRRGRPSAAAGRTAATWRRCRRGAGRTSAAMPLSTVDEVHRVPGDPEEVVVRDLLGDALVPRAQEVDLAGRAHDDAAGAERAGAGVPEDRHARRVADVGDPPEHEHVEVVGLHRGEQPLAAARRGAPGRRGGAQSPYGAYG